MHDYRTLGWVAMGAVCANSLSVMTGIISAGDAITCLYMQLAPLAAVAAVWLLETRP